MKTCVALSISGLLALTTIVSAAPPERKKTEEFWRKVLRFVGIDVNPTNLKKPEDFASGTIWVIDVEKRTRFPVMEGDVYRSPVFEPGDQSLLTLKGNELWRVPLSGGAPRKLLAIPGVLKIVGFNRDSRDEVLILSQGPGDGPAVVGLLSMTSGKLTRLEYSPDSDDQRLVNHLADWYRDYGKIQLRTESLKKGTVLGEVELSCIIMIQRANGERVNLTKDDKVDCIQPSLSWDHRRIAFLKKVEDE